MKQKKIRKSNVYDAIEGYKLSAVAYDAKISYLNSFENDVVAKMMGDLKGKDVLDVGCGTGRLMEVFKSLGGNVVGADISKEMLNLCRQKFPNIKMVKADIESLPFEDESFDFVTAMFVIVHLKKLGKAFDEIHRVLKPGGYFIFSNINQRKGPKIQLENGEEIVIQSYYHMPRHVLEELEKSLFKVEKEELVYENNIWINQIIKARK